MKTAKKKTNSVDKSAVDLLKRYNWTEDDFIFMVESFFKDANIEFEPIYDDIHLQYFIYCIESSDMETLINLLNESGYEAKFFSVFPDNQVKLAIQFKRKPKKKGVRRG